MKQANAAFYISEYGKTVATCTTGIALSGVFEVYQVFELFDSAELHSLRYDGLRRRMDPGFPRLVKANRLGIPRKVNAALKLQGKRKRETIISSLIIRTVTLLFFVFFV